MIACTRNIVVVTSLLLAALAGQATAADRPPRMENPSCAAPVYRDQWRQDEQQGVVTLSVLVGTDGSVRDTKVAQSSGHRSLDKASINALGKCKYQPGLKGGAAVAAWTKIQYNWIIK